MGKNRVRSERRTVLWEGIVSIMSSGSSCGKEWGLPVTKGCKKGKNWVHSERRALLWEGMGTTRDKGL